MNPLINRFRGRRDRSQKARAVPLLTPSAPRSVLPPRALPLFPTGNSSCSLSFTNKQQAHITIDRLALTGGSWVGRRELSGPDGLVHASLVQ